MSNYLSKGGNPQGGHPAKKKKKKSKLKFYPSHNNDMKRKLIGIHFVKMDDYGYFFKVNPDETIDWRNPISEDDMILNLEDLGLEGGSNKIKMLLKSEYIKSVTPLHIIHEQLSQKEWDGVDRISKLVQAFNLAGDHLVNELLIRKWLINTYAVAFKGIDSKLNAQVTPRVEIIFHSEERQLGKSSIMRWLGMSGAISEVIPQIGQEVYSELQSGFGKDDRLFGISLAHSLVLNFDDVGEFFMNHKAHLRTLCTQSKVEYRQLHSQKKKVVPRRAGFCGTTNNSSVLRDPDENRYAVFTLNPEGINWAIMQELDPLDIWREAQALAIKNGFEANWGNNETELVQKISEQYLYKNPLEEFIDGYFEFDPKGAIPPIEVREIIQRQTGVLEDPKRIRYALDRLVPYRESLKKTVNGNNYYKLSIKEAFDCQSAIRQKEAFAMLSAKASSDDGSKNLNGQSDPSNQIQIPLNKS